MDSVMSEPPRADCEVLLGVCGGIAAYKVCHVASRLLQRGAGVTVVMTRAARKFVTPLTFQTLTTRKVHTSLWRDPNDCDARHLSLTASADLFLIAPATANIIGKAAAGIADDLLSTMLLSATCPILFAPAMNPRMWANRIVQANVAKLKEFGFEFLDPAEGRTACAEVGVGRMAEPDTIIEAVVRRLSPDPR